MVTGAPPCPDATLQHGDLGSQGTCQESAGEASGLGQRTHRPVPLSAPLGAARDQPHGSSGSATHRGDSPACGNFIQPYIAGAICNTPDPTEFPPWLEVPPGTHVSLRLPILDRDSFATSARHWSRGVGSITTLSHCGGFPSHPPMKPQLTITFIVQSAISIDYAWRPQRTVSQSPQPAASIAAVSRL